MIRKALVEIYYIWVREMRVVFRDHTVLLIFFLVPFLYPILYSLIYNNEVVRDVNVVVVDNNRTALSREFIRKLDATPDIRIAGMSADMDEAQEAVRRKEAQGVLFIPGDFSQNVYNGRQGQVSVFADMSSILYYKNILLSNMEVSLDMGADIRVEMTGYKSEGEDEITKLPVDSEWVSMYNPQNGFASFLIPAVLILILQQTLLLGISVITGTHNDKKDFRVASHTVEGRRVSAFHLTIGKAFCYATIYAVTSFYVLVVIPTIFRLPQIGSQITIGVFIMPFLLAATLFAMTLSYFCSQREFAMLMFVFTSVPFLFLSGVSWPWEAIPAPLQAIANMIPSTPGIRGFIRISTMGASLTDVWPEYILLWVQAGIYSVTATAMYLWWIGYYDPRRKNSKFQIPNSRVS